MVLDTIYPHGCFFGDYKQAKSGRTWPIQEGPVKPRKVRYLESAPPPRIDHHGREAAAHAIHKANGGFLP